MKSISKFPIILDGGMGRELENIGAPFKQPEWSAQALIDSPDFVSQAHRNFIDACAEIITTNTYALVPFHIGEKRFNEQGAELIKRAAHIARSCITENEKVQVAGCIPPVLGSYRPDLFSKSQAQPIIDLFIQQQQSDVDFWLAETISSIAEAALIKERTSSTGKSTWISFTVKDELSSLSLIRSGETVYDAVTQIAGHNVTAILFNCSCVEVMESALVSAKQALKDIKHSDDILLGVYANNFPPIDEDHQANNGITGIRTDMSVEKYSQFAATWLKVGASIIGGCCGVSPSHIKKLHDIKYDNKHS